MTTKQAPLSPAARFFYDHAGYAHGLDETPEQGRIRCAMNLVAVEGIAREAGMSFSWDIDPNIDSSDFDDSPDPWPLWVCIAYSCTGEIVGSRGGVDFGRDGSPHSNDYRRIIEAELADAHIDAVLATA